MERTEQETHQPTAQPAPEEKLNGIDTQALHATIDAIKADPSKASCKFFAATEWQRGTTSKTNISHFELGGEDIPQDYSITVDEPGALLGGDTAPNPQMILYAALNTCVLNTFIVNASARGIRIDSLEFELEGELDLRGFLGIDESVNAGYDRLTMVCRVTGNGTDDQYQECLEAGTKYSPNFQTISRAVDIDYRLERHH